MTRRGKRGKVRPRAIEAAEGVLDFSTLPTALGNRAKSKGARFPHSHSDDGGPGSTSSIPSPQRGALGSSTAGLSGTKTSSDLAPPGPASAREAQRILGLALAQGPPTYTLGDETPPSISPQRAGRESSQHRLLENQRALKEALHVGGTEDLLLEPLLHRSPQNLRAVALQNLV